MSFESDTSSECSYLYSPDENGTSSTEESSDSGTRSISSDRNVRKRRRRLSSESCAGYFKRFRGVDAEYTSSDGSDKEGKEEAESRGKSNFAEKGENRCGLRDERSEFDGGELHSIIDALDDSIAVDQGLSFTGEFDIRDFDLSFLDRETVRSETYSTFIDGVSTICSETTHSAKERVKQVFLKEFGDHPLKQRVVHDVYGTKYEYRDFHLDYEQICRKFTGTILIISYHGSHIHIIHDCNYSNNSCRCSFNSCIEQLVNRRFARRVIPNWKFTIQHWINLSIYLQKTVRQYVYYNIAGRTWLPSSEARCVRFFEDLQETENGLVEGSDIPVDFSDSIADGSSVRDSNEFTSICDKTDQQDSKCEKRGKGDKIIDFLKDHPTAPTGHIFNTSLWLSSDFKFYDTSSFLVKGCLKIMNNFINNMSFKDIYMYLKTIEPQNLIFNAPEGNIHNYYYNINESLEILEDLLNYQFFNDSEQITNFLNILYNVIDKHIPKKNTIFILSPPNAGKNFFFDAFIHFCLNFGQVGNFNRYCSFPLMECVGKRIILWNEPVLEASATETLKMLFGGDTVAAKVKYQADAVVKRTPVIVLSNNDVFPNDKAFRSRMFSYKWRSYKKLKQYVKRPNPISSYFLLKKYNIIT